MSALYFGDADEIEAWVGVDPHLNSAEVQQTRSLLAYSLNPAAASLPPPESLSVPWLVWALLLRTFDVEAWGASRGLLDRAQAQVGETEWVVHMRAAAALVGEWEDPVAVAKLERQASSEAVALRALLSMKDPARAAAVIDDEGVDLVFRAWIASRVGDPRAAELAIALIGQDAALSWVLLASSAPERLSEVWRTLDTGARAGHASMFLQAAAPSAAARSAVHEAAAWGEAEDPNRRLALAVSDASVGRLDEALVHLQALLDRPDAGSAGRSALIRLCLTLSACGVAEAVARAIAGSAHAAVFAPLRLALDPSLHEDEASVEERQVAADLRAELETLRVAEDRWAAFRPPVPVVLPVPAALVQRQPPRRGSRRAE